MRVREAMHAAIPLLCSQQLLSQRQRKAAARLKLRGRKCRRRQLVWLQLLLKKRV
jgi:hypothetical protein